MTPVQQAIIRATMVTLDAIFEGLTEKLVDECPDGVAWEDHDPATDNARFLASTALDAMRAAFPDLKP